MINIKINEADHAVEEGRTILEVCRELGIDIPHFCYHPGLSIAGNCRMCLVEIKGMPKLMTACSTVVQDGMEILTDSDTVKEARKGVLEFILLDHPVDCPICDKSGECVLQDYNFDYGISKRRSIFPKERHKVEKISEKIYKNDNRCVLCTRCGRFLNEVTKTHEFTTIERGSHTHIACVDPDGLDKNPFSSNIADLCPVGALGLNEFRFRKRVWLTDHVRAVCQGCEAGCNLTVDLHTRHTPLDPNVGPVVRFSSADNYSMQRYFICDEGRYSYKNYNNMEGRLLNPVLNGNEVNEEEALTFLKEATDSGLTGAVVLSPLVSVEENYAAILFAEEKGYDIFRPSPFRKELPEPALFIEKVKAPNHRMMKLLEIPKVTDMESSDYDVVIVLHNIGSIRDNSLVKILSLLKRVKYSITFETEHTEFSENSKLSLPAPMFLEEDGCYINSGKRIQHSTGSLGYPQGVRPLWKWFFGKRFSGPEGLLKQFAKEKLAIELDYEKLGQEGVEL
ncbi:MAG: 2Fe-2S iron-sulfur cluster binding domain-containing protein [Acidobacteria bacterium]|nr:2Fe-2S iron-sulfur cluster binding domain-containing protein [Acidobacteriota bacterium]